MRVLIISLPRTGSNSLMKKYSNDYNLEMFGEPYNKINKYIWTENDYSKDNVVVKTIISQTPNDENNVDFWFNKSKNYDKVILLSRKDLNACAESCAFLSYNLKNGFKFNEKYEWYLTPNMRETITYINKCQKDLEDLSNLLNIEIIYYEDIYDLKSNERLRVKNYKPEKLI